MDKELEKLLREYMEAFDEQFPLMATRGMDDESLKKAIEKCLAENKPYALDNDKVY